MRRAAKGPSPAASRHLASSDAVAASSLATGLVLVLAMAVGAAGCKKEARSSGGSQGRAAGGGRRPAKFPVETAAVALRQVEYAVGAVGSIEAFEIVQVTARVQGVVEKVRFTEGQVVRASAPLVEIEPQRFRLEVESARAALEKAEAGAVDAKAGLGRRQKAVEGAPGLIPGEEIATWQTRVRTAEADIAEKKAALSQAELNLRDAYVRAPTAGMIESRVVQTGQYVQPGTVLATLVRRDPLLLRFSVPGPEAAALAPKMAVRFRLRGDQAGYQAAITHVAQAANATSRMVAVTAEVNSEDRAGLRPGAFVEVTVPVAAPAPTPVLPQTAVRPTERGFVAYVVENGVARERLLTLGLRTPEGDMEIKSGVKPGELAVIRGGEALFDGAEVLEDEQAGGPGAERGRPRATSETLGP